MFDDLDLDFLRAREGVKWNAVGPDVLPAWIADMDFPVPAAVREAIARHADRELGYPSWDSEDVANPLGEAFTARMDRLYGWRPDPAHTRVFTELIQALQVVLFAGTEPGDGVLIHTPAYPPYLGTLELMGRRTVPIPMIDTPDGWSFDAGRLAEDAAGCRVLVLVNPHNPTGRAFRRDELEAIAEVAERHDLLVVSDEILSDLVYAPHEHIPFASVGSGAAARTVTLNSASKGFNLAGLRCSVAHVGHEGLRRALADYPPQLFGDVSALSVTATIAAWEQCDDWLKEALATLDRNRALLADHLPPGVRFRTPEAAYLAWLDCRPLALDRDPAAFFLDHAGVKLVPGPSFGPEGEGFARLNFGTPAPVLRQILTRLTAATPTPRPS
ncbi:MalY/PatB family protein [Bailinhaonella thermotolerans]|uniref:cysteine-S-conjugate beta-lyase n=1 Tax=Bailinhaonella thermotolerans TaxID=1070861 RepID=A0A3A4AX00_9ACTN|nr:aminotransferase class I/II-fold pyridoxal phosphate-dependent enzyme [Bailinhaonella thermotolerans]RJL31904.1 aminotransferase class I/II-fold pyridoxal phosphate-dependent enzyme [Bailinhaonella thermotolerans]